MKGLIVSLNATTASFRDPNSHLYQETMPMAPPTTIVGIAGAALGLGFKDVMKFFKDNKVAVGCRAKNDGFGKDLWNYSKIKSKGVDKDILIREFLYNYSGEIYFTCADVKILREIYKGFEDPTFALTLGNSDELANMAGIRFCESVSSGKSKYISNSWACGNYIEKFELDWDKVKRLPIKSTIRPPIIKRLPVEFVFNEDGGRVASSFSEFTFFGDIHVLRDPIPVYFFDDLPVSLYRFN